MTDYQAVGKRSRNKGAEFERQTAKVLSKWWGFDFHRVPASGGLHWGSSNNVAGDIVVPPEAGFPFVVECKKREEWTIENLFLNNKDIKNWWGQVVGDSKETGKIPMLIFTRNRAKVFVTLPYNYGLIQEIESRGFPLMVSNIEYMDSYGDSHCYKTFTTLQECLLDFKPFHDKDKNYLKYYFKKEYDWEKASLIRETTKVKTAQALPETDTMQNLLDQI